MGKAVRKEQVRSAVTRERLIAATLDEIFEVGYHTATTQEVAARAGVSRGALLHHFPARAGIAQIRSVAAGVTKGKVSLDAFVDFVWTLFSGRFFYLSLEMITEARNDPALREQMIPVVKRFHDALDAVWVDLCKSGERTAREAGIILNMTLCLMRGMGVQSVLRPEPAYYRAMIQAWKKLLPEMINGRTGDIIF